ncbi:hypothetical protein BH09DEP1_BH09DEP1_7440 [soil metagenome]
MNKILIILVFPTIFFAMEQNKQIWDGKHYKNNSSPQFRTAMELLATLNLKKYTHILDVGSGSGQVTAAIATAAPHAQVIGIDLSESMVAEAQKSYPDVPNLTFKQVDAQRTDTFFFPRASNSIDLAFSSAVFLWIKDKHHAIDNIHTALTQGGHMMIKTTAPRAPNHPLNLALMQLAQTPKWAAFAQAYMSKPQSFPISIEQAHQLITPEKWNNISITERGITNLFDSSQEFCEWMQGWMGGMPAVAALEKDKQVELSTDFVNHYLKLPETRNADGKIVYALPGILIEANKK